MQIKGARKTALILLTVAGALGFIFLFSELACRAYLVIKFARPSNIYYGPYGYDRQPLTGFEMTPLVKDRYLHGLHTTYSTNSYGFRGTEEVEQKQAGEIRIALLGGSCVFGSYATSDRTTIAGYLEEKLKETFPSSRFSVMNAANPGYVSYQVLAKLQLKVIDLEPDIVVLYMGWNDLLFSFHSLPFEKNSFYGREVSAGSGSWQAYINSWNRNIPVKFLRPFALTMFMDKAYRNLVRETLDIYRITHPNGKTEAKNSTYPAQINGKVRKEILKQFYDNLSSILAILKYRKISTILITLASEYDLFPEYRNAINALIKQAAAESGAYLIDADQILLSRHISGINRPEDRYHFSDKGNEFMASLIADKIIQIINIKQ